MTNGIESGNGGRTGLDWAAARGKIDQAGARLADGYALTPERERALLEQRARALARVPDRRSDDTPAIKVVLFSMAHERYAIDATLVREVYPLRELTSIPGVPSFVQGIVNVRGRVLSLIDLKKFFSLPEKGLAEKNQIIILASDDMEFGILADSIDGVGEIFMTDLDSDLPTLTGLRRNYLLGICPEGTVVLDARRILKDPGIIVRDAGTV